MVMTINKKLIRDLYKLKSEVITIALVVCSGIAVLISSVNTYQSLQNAQTKFYSDYQFADIFASLERAPKYLKKQISEISGVAQADTRIVEEVILDLPWLDEPAIGKFISMPDNRESSLNKLYLNEGRWLDPVRNNEVLVNEGFAKANGVKPGDSIIAILKGHKESLKIVGIVLSPEYIYAIRADELLPDNKHFGIFWMNEKALGSALGMEESFNDISLTLAPGASEKLVRSNLERIFLKYGLTLAYSRDDHISDRFVTNEIKQQRILALFIPPIFMLVAAFLLNLVTGRLINKQREQLAILKAIGYNSFSIALYYIKFVLVIIILGTIFGIGLGAWLGELMTQLYAEYFKFPVFKYVFSVNAALIGVFISFIAAASGVLRAVYHVINLAPAVAMRPPIPQTYKTIWVGKNKFVDSLSSSSKMSYRYIIRHPIRTLVTSFGIASAMSIVILGLFWNDAVRYMINTQFENSQREDASISFTQPLQDNVLNQINNIIGITDSEGYRVVPARISRQHYTEQTALFGIPKNAKLKVLLDDNLKKISIPAHGLVLSSALAGRLKIKTGNEVLIEILEANRAKINLKVHAIVNDYIGMFAYTDISLVNDLLNEDSLINYAAIMVDTKYKNKLYIEIKNIPKVSAITFKSSIIKSFEETFAKHLLVFTTILSSFAIIIAVSVVYNNAIITLAERAWELATLRVLGFRQSEVANLFLINIIFEVIIAIPFGIVLGFSLSWIILQLMQADWFIIPFIITTKTYAISVIVVLFASLISFFVIRRLVKKFDLTSVLKVVD